MFKLITGIALIFFVTVSCKKSDTTPEPGDNPTHYLLTHQTFTNGTPSQDEGLILTYNSDNQVSSIKRYSYVVSSSKPDTFYTTFLYNKYGHCSMAVYRSSFNAQYPDTMFYQYAVRYSRQVTMAVYHYYSGGVFNTTTYYYSYDASGNLTAQHDTTYGDYYNDDYSYNAMNNIKAIDHRWLESSTPKIARYEFVQFDDKVNFMLAINGLPVSFWNYVSKGGIVYSQTTPHNATTQRLFYGVTEGQPYTYSRDNNYSYDYNEDGLPVKMTFTYGTFTFEYKKYK
jgi:hypothetical protein